MKKTDLNKLIDQIEYQIAIYEDLQSKAIEFNDVKRFIEYQGGINALKELLSELTKED